jgi:deoxyinosine 3'endonuclease (endonuclease V)
MGGAWGRGELQRDEVCSDINSDTVTAVVWTKKNKQFVIMVSFKDKVRSRSPPNMKQKCHKQNYNVKSSVSGKINT